MLEPAQSCLICCILTCVLYVSVLPRASPDVTPNCTPKQSPSSNHDQGQLSEFINLDGDGSLGKHKAVSELHDSPVATKEFEA